MRYLIVGMGVAGVTAAEEIRKRDPEGRIILCSEEDLPFYWRTRLNDFIAGEVDESGLVAKPDSWYKDRSIEVTLNTRIADADPEKRQVVPEHGGAIPYDRLLLATGSHSFLPPIKGSDKPGVFTLRTIQDARRIRRFMEAVNRVALIGGGLLGLETANAFRKQGKACTVVEFFPRLLPRQLDPAGAETLRGLMEAMGFRFRLGAKTREIAGNDRVEGVVLESGEILEAGMVIVSAGVRPNLGLAQALGLDTDKGIRVDEHLRTSREEVFAAGDAAEYRGTLYGIWPAAMEQGRFAGINMAGGKEAYEGTTMATTLKVAGIDVASAGDIDPDNQYESRIVSKEGIYQKIVIRDNRIVGCVLVGDTRPYASIRKRMEEKQDISAVRDTLLA